MKAVNVTTNILIQRPREVVAAFASNPDNATKWYANIKSVEWRTPRPLKAGSQIAFAARFLGRRLAYVYEVVEWIPNEKFVMRTADGPFPMETTYRWEKISETETRMFLQNTGTPSGFSAFLAPFMTGAMRKANIKDLKLLKDILENNQQ